LRVGVLCPKWGFTFINPVINELKKKHQVETISEPFTHVRMANLVSRVDVVFVEWIGQHLTELCELPKLKPIIVRGHFSDLRSRSWGSWIRMTNWEKVDLIIFTNKFLMDEFFENHKNIKVKGKVIRLGVDLDVFKLKPNSYNRVIGFNAFIKPVKDPLPVIEMMETLKDWILILKATPSYDKMLENKVSLKVCSMNNVIWIKDWLPLNKLVELYQSMDVFVNNSLAEGQGVAILEAMACGVYTLIRNWKHAEELYPKELLFRDINECRQKILEWDSKSNDEKREISIKMREFVEKNYNGRRYVKEMIETIERVK